MIIPLVAGALYCATPKLDNKTDTWTEVDQNTLLDASKYGCKNHNPQMPCLVKFTKIAENEYMATCGPEKRRENE